MSKQPFLTGLVVPAFVPYQMDGGINYAEYQRFLSYLCGHGASGIFVCGTSGEFLHQTMEERKGLLNAAVEAIPAQAHIMYNISSVLLSEVETYAEHARKCGVHAVSVIAPYYFSHTEESLLKFFSEVSRITADMDLYFYNFPERTGNPITPALVKKLLPLCPNLRGGKDSSKNFDQMMNYKMLCGQELEFISGDDMQVYSTALLGCKGAISGMGNVVPELLGGIFDLVNAGRYQEAFEAQKKANRIKAVIGKSGTLMAYKRAAEFRGFDMGPMRLPFTDISEDAKAAIQQVMRQNGII